MSTVTQADRRWLLKAVELSRSCPRTDAEGYHVGAIIVAADGRPLAEGFSRDTHPQIHAEESALAKLAGRAPEQAPEQAQDRAPEQAQDRAPEQEQAQEQDADLAGATIYSTMEPCSIRKSRPRTCTELILAAGIRRVVFAVREPPLFVECHGIELLRAGGADVIEIADLADLVWAVNAPVLTGSARAARCGAVQRSTG